MKPAPAKRVYQYTTSGKNKRERSQLTDESTDNTTDGGSDEHDRRSPSEFVALRGVELEEINTRHDDRFPAARRSTPKSMWDVRRKLTWYHSDRVKNKHGVKALSSNPRMRRQAMRPA